MVDSESAVLPAPAAFDPADSGDSSSESESDAPFASRPSRPFQDNGWMDGDHSATVYAIHRIGQILRCGADDLESFSRQ